MPHYDYRCTACGHEFELYQGIREAPRRKCPTCGKLQLKRLLGGGGGVIFKGSGFYQTDYKASPPPPCGASGSEGGCADGKCPLSED